jgi:hypothetical protein
VDGFAHADGGEVAIALVGENNPPGQDAFDARGNGGGTAMGGFADVAADVKIGQDRTTGSMTSASSLWTMACPQPGQ